MQGFHDVRRGHSRRNIFSAYAPCRVGPLFFVAAQLPLGGETDRLFVWSPGGLTVVSIFAQTGARRGSSANALAGHSYNTRIDAPASCRIFTSSTQPQAVG